MNNGFELSYIAIKPVTEIISMNIFRMGKKQLCTTAFTRFLLLSFLLTTNLSFGQFAGGSGTIHDPYLIADINQLQSIRNAPNSSHFRLVNDINASVTNSWNGGQGFNPIGWFNGTIDGSGFTVSGLVINRPGFYQSSLITQLGSDGIVKNINFNTVYINGGGRTASIVGTLAGKIENTTVSGVVIGSGTVGGITGIINSGGIVSNVNFSGTVNSSNEYAGGITGMLNSNSLMENVTMQGSVTGTSLVGGLAGQCNSGSSIIRGTVSANVTGSGNDIGGAVGYSNSASISQSTFSGSVSGNQRIGGLIGKNEGSIIDCNASAIANGTNEIGGLVGHNNGGLIEKAYSTGRVEGTTSVGGLVGFSGWNSSSIIRLCFSTSDVNPTPGGGNKNQVGGLVGRIQGGTIENCFARGSVTGNNRVGGLVGEMTSGANIVNSFSTGLVSGGAGQFGGLVGRVQGASVVNSFWDVITSGLSFSAAGTPKTTAEMVNLNTFLVAGWNFNTIWAIDTEINNGYPYLQSLSGFFMILWTGNIDSAWEKSGNWSNNVLPGLNATVRIPNVQNKPIVSTDIVIGSLFIQPNSRVTVAHDGKLSVTGSLNNMAGTAGLVIQSNQSGTGSLIHYSNEVQGTFQRFIHGEPEDWHLLSSPVANQAIAGDFIPSGTYGDGTGYDFYLWHEPDTSWVYLLNNQYPPTWLSANGSNHFVPGRGYLVSYQITGTTKEFSGVFQNGTVNIGVTRSAGNAPEFGSNLVGNPYPSSIDWKSISGWNRSVLESNGGGYDFWIWNDAANNYGVYNSNAASDFGTLGVSRYIAPTQAFFVKAAYTGSIIVNNQARVNKESGNWLKTNYKNADRVTLRVSCLDGCGTDEVTFEIGNDNTGGAAKKFSFVKSAPSLYIPIKNQSYSMLLMQHTNDNPVQPVAFKAGRNGSYSIKAVFNPDEFEALILEDLATGFKQNLKENPEYYFQAEIQDNSSRFILYFKEGNFANPFDHLPARIYAHNKIIFADMQLVDAGSEYILQAFDALGRIVLEQFIFGSQMNQIPAAELQGIHIVRITGPKGGFVSKLIL